MRLSQFFHQLLDDKKGKYKNYKVFKKQTNKSLSFYNISSVLAFLCGFPTVSSTYF